MTPVTSPTPSTGAVVVPADETITADAIAQLLAGGGMHVAAVTADDDIVIATRPVLGVPHVIRQIVARRTSESTWEAAHVFVYLRSRQRDLTDLKAGFRDVLALGLWIGGVLSKPYNHREVEQLLGAS